MKRLTDNITSKYVEAMNRLSTSRSRTRIIAFVESYDDVAFWRLLLDEFENDDYYFQIMLPSKGGLTKGKKSAITSIMDSKHLGSYMIACVDSDYDYLMQGLTPASKELIENPYIIHTYTYAIENYQCYAGCLHQICVQSTLNDHINLDFHGFMEMYSEIVFPLFAWNIWFYRNRRHNQYSIMDFNSDVRLRGIDPKRPQESLLQLEDKVDRKLRALSEELPDAVPEIEALKEELIGLGVQPDQTYLFVQGHSLIDNVMLKLLQPICARLVQEREMEIRHFARHQQQYENEISAYRHSQISIEEALRKNTHYRECSQYDRMRADVANLLSMLPERRHKDDKDRENLKSSNQHQ